MCNLWGAFGASTGLPWVSASVLCVVCLLVEKNQAPRAQPSRGAWVTRTLNQ